MIIRGIQRHSNIDWIEVRFFYTSKDGSNRGTYVHQFSLDQLRSEVFDDSLVDSLATKIAEKLKEKGGENG